jgi:hypothetical protein
MSVESQWYVRLANGNVITVSLDDLDAAFQRGDVNESTLVFRQGMKEWLPLGEAAGLDEANDTTQTAPPEMQQPAAQIAQLAPITAPPSSMTPFAVSVAPVSQYTVQPSTMPVAFDTPASFDPYMDEPQFKSSKKKVIFGVIAAAAVIGLGIVGLSSIKGTDPAAASTNVAPVVAAAAAPPPAATTIPEAAPTPQNRLSDEQRKALMSFDDKNNKAAAQKPLTAPPRCRSRTVVVAAARKRTSSSKAATSTIR